MGNLYLCPYICKYINELDIAYDIIYWDRDGIEEDSGAECLYKFSCPAKSNEKKGISKIFNYIKYMKFVNKILIKNEYSCVILLQTLAGILTYKTIRKQYRGKYILDIRDYTFERNIIFYNMEKALIESSAMTVISSEGFRRFLPKHDYVAVHNSRKLEDEAAVNSIRNRAHNKSKLVIAFIGYISYQEQHKKLLLLFKNDSRFKLAFIGKEANALIPFCEEHSIENVRIIDKFLPQEILNYYKDVDFINNLYGNHTPILDYALSNKLYFAAKLHIPILACADTYMSEISRKYNFGYELDLDDNESANKLFEYYRAIDWDSVSKGCDEFTEIVNEENALFASRLRKVVRQK